MGFDHSKLNLFLTGWVIWWEKYNKIWKPVCCHSLSIPLFRVLKNTTLMKLIKKYRQKGRTTQVTRSHTIFFTGVTVVPIATLVSLVQQIKELERNLFPCLQTRLSEDLCLLVCTSKVLSNLNYRVENIKLKSNFFFCCSLYNCNKCLKVPNRITISFTIY